MPQSEQLRLDVLPDISASQLRLTTDGRIVDFLDSTASRANTPEERVRQTYARKLHLDYGYPKEWMRFGAPINIGSEERFADIVVYRDKATAVRTDQAAIRFIVETKAPDVKKGEAQLKSYIFGSSAEGGVWINQNDAPKYFRRVDIPQRGLQEWPNLPQRGEEWEGVGKHTKSQLRAPHDLVETFRRCHNVLYKSGIDSEDLAMDMVRMILAKYRDEVNEGDVPQFRCTPLQLQSERGRKQVANQIRRLFVEVRDDHSDVFNKNEEITAGDRDIATVVSELQDFRFVPDEDADDIYDVVGAAYEVYVGHHLKGPRGQYFTPRLIVQLLTRLVGPTEKDVILDPAMGSGGFLIAAMRQITRQINQSNRSSQAKRGAVRAMRGRLYGVEKAPKLVKVARTNMILANDGHAGLVTGDSLEPIDRLGAEFARRPPTVILTNPPFGATSEHKLTAEKEPDILGQFEVGHVWKKQGDVLQPTDKLTGEGCPPEYLFVERCLQWLAPGGRLGIVVPRGVLDNDKALPVRTYLLRHARIEAVVNCHDDTFKPHTDAKAAFIVCQKKEVPSDADDDYPIFMAVSQAIGHTALAQPIYKTDSKGDVILENGRPILDQDLDDIYAAWSRLRGGGASSGPYYMTSRRKLTTNLNLNPVRYLPEFSDSIRLVHELGERDGWKVEHLGHIAQVYNGPRFKRPYADKGVTSGPGILRYFTGNAVTQTKGENIKYLDLKKAKKIQLKMIEKLYLRRGMILITDSGTVGRVIYVSSYHEGAIGTNNLIRVEVENEALRGYVYQFLSSRLGQDQLKKNVYGAIVDHLEPKDVKQVLVPVPTDEAMLEAIGKPVIEAVEFQEQANARLDRSKTLLGDALAPASGAGMPKQESTARTDASLATDKDAFFGAFQHHRTRPNRMKK